MQAETKKNEKNILRECEQNYCDTTQHMPQIIESRNELVKIQGRN